MLRIGETVQLMDCSDDKSWVPTMDNFVGATGKVTEVFSDGWVGVDFCGFLFDSKWFKRDMDVAIEDACQKFCKALNEFVDEMTALVEDYQ